ncbi:hydroxymethylglutaryl-CoA reductase [Peribacillus deserti]|uniref:Hydroxymethylglutaryl-CoA reductase n=1 Tax=Peribacillus deserti TaxID=673318 RepID=A0ABS2QH53_9BACI|nr:hypothetical protein [Peribacillus deserti]MBM7692458.1 hydroxymethylglutaryl-CoA reductase [Peribacillus deserti]
MAKETQKIIQIVENLDPTSRRTLLRVLEHLHNLQNDNPKTAELAYDMIENFIGRLVEEPFN